MSVQEHRSTSPTATLPPNAEHVTIMRALVSGPRRAPATDHAAGSPPALRITTLTAATQAGKTRTSASR
jgi:hypothetical protein